MNAFERFQHEAARLQQTLMIELSARRQKIFWGPGTLREPLLELLSRLHLDGEYIDNQEEQSWVGNNHRPIGIEDKIVIDNLTAALAGSGERKAFLLTPNYWFAYWHLTRRGYRAGEDFIDARALLPDLTGQCVPNVYKIIKGL